MDADDLITLSFADVEKYHGQHSIGGAALGFQVLRAALGALYPSITPRRADIAIVSGHPGNGFRDAFEMVTRAVSRGAYTVDTSRPGGRHNPLAAHAYSWEVTGAHGRRVELELRPGLIPFRFFELWQVVGQGVATPADWQELIQVKRSLADHALTLPLDTLFEVRAATPA
ncbi:MAG: hypothetical protein IT306_00225 [Chloroflexi bacterium]|nr:hypothetical protein [Chloroflexota bacterium]